VRYVILEHDHPQRHWDFMLEAGDVLRTWRLAKPPQPGETVGAEATFDHRSFYLDYEGPVSGNRGTVVRWDAGTFTWLQQAGDCLVVRLNGERLNGEAVLRHNAAGDWELSLAETETGPNRPPSSW
jgi:hypothetical protein